MRTGEFWTGLTSAFSVYCNLGTYVCVRVYVRACVRACTSSSSVCLSSVKAWTTRHKEIGRSLCLRHEGTAEHMLLMSVTTRLH